MDIQAEFKRIPGVMSVFIRRGLTFARAVNVRRFAGAITVVLPLAACEMGTEETPAPLVASASREPMRADSAFQAVASPAPSTTQLPQIRATGGRLTVQVRDEPLGLVLDAIAAQAGVGIHLDPLLRTHRLTAAVQDRPLAEGLMVTLRDLDVVLSMGSNSSSAVPASLRGAWVFPRGRGPAGGGSAPAGLTASSAAEVRRCDREQTQPESVDPQQLAQDLVSTDARVRHRALDRSILLQLPLPATALRRLAMEDPEAAVRALALTAWSQDAQTEPREMRPALQHALQDRDNALRERARQLLEQLDMAALSNEAATLPDTTADSLPP